MHAASALLVLTLAGPAAASPRSPAAAASAHLAGPCDVRARTAGLGGFAKGIALAADGLLYVGTPAGLVAYDGEVERTVAGPGEIVPLTVDGDQQVWVMHQDGRRLERGIGPGRAAVRLDGDAGAVEDLITDARGALWATTPRALLRWDGQALALVHTWPDRVPGSASRLWRLGEHLAWEAAGRWAEVTPAGLGAVHRVGEAQGQARNDWILDRTLPRLAQADRDRLRSARIEDTLRDARGRIWVGSSRGLLCVAGEHAAWIDDGLPDTHVRQLREDREGNVWVRTQGGQVVQLEPAVVSAVTLRHGLEAGVTYGLAQTPDGTVWASTPGGLVRIDGQQVALEAVTTGGRPLPLRALLATRDGTLWAATNGPELVERTARTGPVRTTAWTLPDALEGERVSALAELEGGDVAVGTTAARLLRRTRAGWQLLHQPHPPCERSGRFEGGACAEAASALLARPEGGWWIGTFEAGLWELTDVGPRRAAVRGQKDRPIWSLWREADGTLWVAGSGGLGRLTGGVLHFYRDDDGLIDPVVFGGAEDAQGRLWLGGLRGVQVIDKRGLLAGTARATGFDARDGLPSDLVMGAYEAGVLRARDGRIWFATVAGLGVVDPGHLRVPPSPEVVVRSLTVDGRPLDVTSGSELTTRPGAAQVAFELGAVVHAARHRVRYQHRILRAGGPESSWLEAPVGRRVTHENLASGRYRIQARALRDGAERPGPPATVLLHIPPRWYERWQILGAIALGAVSVVVGAVRWRLRRLRSRFRAVTEERRRIARDLHDSLAQIFAALSFQVDVLSRGTERDRARPLQELKRMVGHARRATRSVVWNLRSAPEDTDALRRSIAELAGFYEGAKVTVTTTGTACDLPLNITSEILSAAQQAISNAIEHGRANVVTVELDYSDRAFTLWVRDDGCGFDVDQSGVSADGPHFGLRGMQERAERAGGVLRVESRPGVGTEIALSVPRRRRARWLWRRSA